MADYYNFWRLSNEAVITFTFQWIEMTIFEEKLISQYTATAKRAAALFAFDGEKTEKRKFFDTGRLFSPIKTATSTYEVYFNLLLTTVRPEYCS